MTQIINTGALKTERAQTPGEEIANSVSHGAALLASLLSMPYLIVQAARKGDAAVITGVSIFGATVALLYLASMLYHALPPSKAKQRFRVLEHGAIFLLIAGTYTPFTLGVMRGAWGWSLFGVVWGLALCGVILKAVGGVKYPVFSNILYVSMGWVIVVAFRPLYRSMPIEGVAGLILGGVAYTAGLGFYAANRMPYAHFIWHLFVIAGTTLHYLTLLWYAF